MANRDIISPRLVRALDALLEGAKSREQLDRICGASNSPDVIYRLRGEGLSIPCVMTKTLDRDGLPCRIGVYQLTPEDADLVRRLFAEFFLGSWAG